ncbi:helix-turn-helix domain-containing protein [Anaerotruncus rubiinfantis]|uniref:helix-turn-helix domain-containing protein n=1 Tax=Anaerotruncus rubiinfantis TaxID=1720200 RepID=UPI0008314602
MMKNSKYDLVPYEVIERAITGDTAALLAVQERHKAYIGRLSRGNADMKERLNAKLLMAVLKFQLEYQSPHK